MPHSDKVIIKDLSIRCIVGIYPEERVNEQEVLLNIVATTDVTVSAETKDITHALNYHALCEAVIKLVQAGQYELVETMALDVARLVVVEFGAERALVRVEKPEALDYTQSVGVEIERAKEDFAQ